MLVRTLSIALLVVVLTNATPAVPRGQRQFGFFNPGWGFPGSEYDESVEDSSSKADYPDYTNLGSMLQGMQTMMTRMRQQLAEAMNRFPPIPKLPNNTPFSPSDAGFDESKPTNTSSVTKVVNGHKVTVNETTYSSGDGGNTHVFRIKTVDISPHKDDAPESMEVSIESDKHEDSKEVTTDSASSTTSAASFDNEIPQKRHGKLLHEAEWQQDFPERQNRPSSWSNVFPGWPSVSEYASKWRQNTHKSIKEERGQSPDIEILPHFPSKPIDLSNDLRVNQILSEKANAGALILPDPDSEFIELKDGKIVPSIQYA